MAAGGGAGAGPARRGDVSALRVGRWREKGKFGPCVGPGGGRDGGVGPGRVPRRCCRGGRGRDRRRVGVRRAEGPGARSAAASSLRRPRERRPRGGGWGRGEAQRGDERGQRVGGRAARRAAVMSEDASALPWSINRDDYELQEVIGESGRAAEGGAPRRAAVTRGPRGSHTPPWALAGPGVGGACEAEAPGVGSEGPGEIWVGTDVGPERWRGGCGRGTGLREAVRDVVGGWCARPPPRRPRGRGYVPRRGESPRVPARRPPVLPWSRRWSPVKRTERRRAAETQLPPGCG